MENMRFYCGYDDEKDVAEQIMEHLDANENCLAEGLMIGCWRDAWECAPSEIIDVIIQNKTKFPNLKSIYLGDMESEDCEISWICHTDTAALINELELESLTVKGATGLRFDAAKSENLKTLVIVSGGMSSKLLGDIARAELPNLEYLELYLGVEDYGFDGNITDVEPFMQKRNFPKLKYLGLKNSEIQDEICEKIIDSDIIDGLDVLDLSLGTLSDKGAKLILDHINKFSHLKKLDLTYNYISDELVEKLEKAFASLNVELLISRDDVYIDEDYEYRFPYITE